MFALELIHVGWSIQKDPGREVIVITLVAREFADAPAVVNVYLQRSIRHSAFFKGIKKIEQKLSHLQCKFVGRVIPVPILNEMHKFPIASALTHL